jgi:hypothetical protein
MIREFLADFRQQREAMRGLSLRERHRLHKLSLSGTKIAHPDDAARLRRLLPPSVRLLARLRLRVVLAIIVLILADIPLTLASSGRSSPGIVVSVVAAVWLVAGVLYFGGFSSVRLGQPRPTVGQARMLLGEGIDIYWLRARSGR